MTILLRSLAILTPAFIKKKLVQRLLQLTAAAFGAPAPSLNGLSFNDSLTAFAIFTKDEAETALRSGKDMRVIQGALYHRAYELGAQCRRWLWIREMDDVMAAARMLYSFCKIDFQGVPDGSITIGRCYFSDYYSSAVCQSISALDAGLLAGLSGGRRLTFSQRITEGSAACRALLVEGDAR